MSLSQWATMNPQLAGVIISVVVGPLIMMIASRLLSIRQVESPAGAPIAAPTADVRSVLAEIAASERLSAKVLEEIASTGRANGHAIEELDATIDDAKRTQARHSNALDRIEDMLRRLTSDHDLHSRRPRD